MLLRRVKLFHAFVVVYMQETLIICKLDLVMRRCLNFCTPFFHFPKFVEPWIIACKKEVKCLQKYCTSLNTPIRTTQAMQAFFVFYFAEIIIMIFLFQPTNIFIRLTVRDTVVFSETLTCMNYFDMSMIIWTQWWKHKSLIDSVWT